MAHKIKQGGELHVEELDDVLGIVTGTVAILEEGGGDVRSVDIGHTSTEKQTPSLSFFTTTRRDDYITAEIQVRFPVGDEPDDDSAQEGDDAT